MRFIYLGKILIFIEDDNKIVIMKNDCETILKEMTIEEFEEFLTR